MRSSATTYDTIFLYTWNEKPKKENKIIIKVYLVTRSFSISPRSIIKWVGLTRRSWNFMASDELYNADDCLLLFYLFFLVLFIFSSSNFCQRSRRGNREPLFHIHSFRWSLTWRMEIDDLFGKITGGLPVVISSDESNLIWWN